MEAKENLGSMRSRPVNITIFLALTIGLAHIFASPAKAQNSRNCPALQSKIDFSVTTKLRPITYDVSASQSQMTRMANKSRSSRLRKNERALGLTSNGHSVAYKMSSQVARLTPNRYCARVASVDMEIVVTRLKVYILGKYRRGSCQYAAIIDHEHEHVVTFQNGIETMERTFNNRMWSLIRNL